MSQYSRLIPVHSQSSLTRICFDLDDEHDLYKFIFRHKFNDPLFIGPVAEVLKPDSQYEQKRVLDLGTGAAAWYVLARKPLPILRVADVYIASCLLSSFVCALHLLKGDRHSE